MTAVRESINQLPEQEQPMFEQMPKEAYLANLRERNQQNRELVERVFLPLEEAEQ